MKRLHRKKAPEDLLSPRPGRKRRPHAIQKYRGRSCGGPAVIGARGQAHHELLETLTGCSGDDTDDERPITRADCIDGPRPCPRTSCRHHVGVDVTRHGGLRITWPELQIGEILYSCALDVADDYPDGLGQDQVSAIVNLSNERVRQIEIKALRKIRRLMEER